MLLTLRGFSTVHDSFNVRFSRVVDQETPAWVDGISEQPADLEKTLAAQKDAARATAEAAEKAASAPQTGAIAINLSEVPSGETEVLIDEQRAGAFVGKQFGKTDVPQGLHVVRLTAQKTPSRFGYQQSSR